MWKSVRRTRQLANGRRLGLLVTCVFLAGHTNPVFSVDCNRNGVDDGRDIAELRSQDCNGNAVPDECEDIPVELTSPQGPVNLPSAPQFVATGDLDGDESTDVVVASRAGRASTLSFFTWDNGGSLIQRRLIHVGNKVYSVAISDVDGDGDNDLVTSNVDVFHVYVNRGGGAFESSVQYPTSGDSRFATTADLDNDGFPEVVTANRKTTTISVYPNNGDGTFGELVTHEGGDDPESLVAGDFDGDGSLDIASVNKSSNDFSLHFNDGNGSLAAARHFAAGESRPGTLTAEDMNGDGMVDLLAIAGRTLVLLVNQGERRFAAAKNFNLPGPARGLSTGDFDRDGDNDVIIGSNAPLDDRGGVHAGRTRVVLALLRNNGEGGFDQWGEYFTPPGGVASVVAGDFDLDQDVDLVVTTSPPATVVAYSSGTGIGLPVEVEEIPLPACTRIGQGCRPHSVRATDLDGDGDLDPIGCNTHPGAFSILVNDGDGNFTHRLHTFTNNTRVRALGMEAGDLDLDGDIDLVSVDNYGNTFWVHENTGDGTLIDEVRYNYRGAGGPGYIELADFDGDGDLDVAIANETTDSVSVLFNKEARRESLGGRAFVNSSRDVYSIGRYPTTLAVADVDNDGDIDLGVASDRIVMLLNDGEGRFIQHNYRLRGDPNGLTIGDFDEDGSLDILSANFFEKSLSLLRGLGDGRFAAEREYALVAGPYSVESVDYNGDGHLDAVASNEAANTASVLLGNGDGTFGARSSFPAGAGPRWLMVLDYDQDGDVDIVSANREAQSFTKITNLRSAAENSYLESICTPADFHRMSRPATIGGVVGRVLKYVLPATESAESLPTLFQNSGRFELHFDFLRQSFPKQFGALSAEDYVGMVERRATRQYFVGTISRVLTEDEGLVYGFNFFARFDVEAERPTSAEVKAIYDRLRESFHLGPLVYAPRETIARKVAEEWAGEDPGFPIRVSGGSTLPFQAYTGGVAYGRVRILTREEFEEANDQGLLSSQDGLILDHAPRDILGVVAFVATAEEQGELSHLAIRTNRRGTPNALVKDALEVFSEWNGKLVRFEVTGRGYVIEEASQEEAEAFWRENRPELAVLPEIDEEYAGLPTLEEITAMEDAGAKIVARVGGKASNLARLQRVLTDERSEYQEKGFAIPLRYYLEFMRSNQLPSALDSTREVSYEAYLEELFVDGEFQTNPSFRFEALDGLRDHIRDEGVVDPELVQTIAARISEVLGTPSDTRVRFRSSSNIEDDIQFNGAGLYDSTSGCPEDDLDDEEQGPSHCDPMRENERTIVRALKRVWRSLWNFGAFEEREHFQVPQQLAAMGVLVNRTFDESANGVAFTGNPQNPFDGRYVITAQKGEESVVSPEPGVLAEKDVLEIADGEVLNIIRAVPSSLIPPGTYVLSDDQLEELGRLMAHIDVAFPVDVGGFDRTQALLDLEFKFMPDGELVVKQVRPFLLSTSLPPPPTFELEIPPDTLACGVFLQGRGNRAEYALKSQLRFVEGTHLLPAGSEVFSASLIEEVILTQDRLVASSSEPGVFRLTQTSVGTSDEWTITYRFDYEQSLTLPDGESVVFVLEDLRFVTRSEETPELRIVLDEKRLAESLLLETTLPESFEPRPESGGMFRVSFGSCSYETFPVWEIRAELADGTSLFLEERYDKPDSAVAIAPAALARADVTLSGEVFEVADYWNLSYTAARHNTGREYWVVLDPPRVVSGLEEPVRVLELIGQETSPPVTASARYLGASFEVLSEVSVSSFRRIAPAMQRNPTLFRRGDADADGDVTLTDAVALLRYLFFSGVDTLSCLKAGDANDTGRLNTTDAVRILVHLFGTGEPLPGPFALCGRDSTADRLSCQSFAACE